MKRQELRIFLSSPGDVAAERRIAREILDALNTDPFIRDRAMIEVIAWEAPGSRVLMPVSLTPQQAIDRNLAKPSETDATVVLFWGRMGTPLDIKKHGNKPDGTPYQSGTEWEYLDAMNGAKKHPANLPIVLLYRRTDATTPPQQKDFSTVRQYLEASREYLLQLERVETFFEPFRDPVSKAYRGNVIEYTSPDDFRDLFTKDARLLVKELLQIHEVGFDADKETPVTIDWKGSPFPGLRAFTEQDEPIFFGRGYEVADLIKRLSSHRLMFVVGASGSGKSSLVGAGVIPQLKRGALYGVGGWHIVRFTPGDDPFLRLSKALIRVIPALHDPIADDEERAAALAKVLRKSPDKLTQQVEKWLKSDGTPSGIEVLLFVDQFEELFTTTTADDRAAFAAMLQAESPQIRIIATMRSDFYDRALPYFETVLRDASYTLNTPSPIALYEMINRPAEVTGLVFEAGLAEEIVNRTTGQIGGLALVAYLLEALYLRHLTWADYHALGGVDGAIGKRASDTFDALELADKDAVLKCVFRELVTVNENGTPTRQRADADRFDEDAVALIRAFIQSRLLVAHGDTVEVAHEALFRNWERLKNWIAEAQEDLILLRQVRNATEEWHGKDRPDFLLWPQERLVLVYGMIDRLKPELSEIERDFIEPEQERLYRELAVITTTHQRRYDIGERLARIGDTRDGIGVKDGLPDMVWLPVDGSNGKYKFDFGEFEVKPFFVAKYLVTTTQLQAFLDSDWDNPRWWDGFPKDYQPQRFRNVTNGNANAPRDTISWYQGVAFGRWLTVQFEGLTLEHSSGAILRVGENADIRLPTEWEWQWAAQAGQEARQYPWGDWDEHPRANTTEAGINDRSTAVGMYPHGVAACGALDMSGNLWEWCQNDHGNPRIVDGYDNSERKVLRGGSFLDNQFNAAASSRYDFFNPDLGYSLFGVRLVVCLRPIKSL